MVDDEQWRSLVDTEPIEGAIKMTKQTSLTPNEHKVLRALLTNDYGDGGDGPTYAWAINHAREPSGITGKSLSGVVASLSKKGLVRCEEWYDEGVVQITEAGIALATLNQ